MKTLQGEEDQPPSDQIRGHRHRHATEAAPKVKGPLEEEGGEKLWCSAEPWLPAV